jgi:cysteine-S-conjugate beta-lyase
MAKNIAKKWKTKLIHSDVKVPEGFRALSAPVTRASTVLFSNAAASNSGWDPYTDGYTYGTHGTPTTVELAARVCELEGGTRTLLAPSGLAAISLINFALLKTGDHVLVPISVYGPNRKFASVMLRRFGVETTFYAPGTGAEIAALLRETTRLVWCESPGSVTMEVEDVPAIVAEAHRAGALVALDNTWAAGVYFDAFAHGIDVTMQALTKYIAGHSDVLLGSVTVRDEKLHQRMGETHNLLGYSVSADECSLALRGMKTLAVRLQAIEKTALAIAGWLAARPEVELVLHPALPSCPGHEFWKRDFTGSAGVFAIVLRKWYAREQVLRFVDALELFKIGYSWGGVTSLVIAYDLRGNKERPDYGHRIVRLNIGLEDVGDLESDLARGLERLA